MRKYGVMMVVWLFLAVFCVDCKHKSDRESTSDWDTFERTLNDSLSQMKVDYALDMNEEHVADCYLTVQAQSKDSADFVL